MQSQTTALPKTRRLSTILATALFSLSAVVLLLYSALVIYHDFRIRQTVIVNRQQLAAQAAAKTVSNFLNEHFSILDTAIWLTQLDTLPERGQRDILRSLLGLRTAFRRLVLLDAQNQVLVQASRLSSQTSQRYADQLEGFLAGQVPRTKRMISQAYIDPVTSEPMVTIAAPVLDLFGDLKGMLIAELNLKSMWEIVDRLKVGETGCVYVTDRKGNLLAFRDTARVLKGENVSQIKSVADFIRNSASLQPSTAAIYRGIEGSTVVGTYAPLKTPDWAVVTELPWKEAYRATFQDIAAAAGITLTLAILAGVFGFFVAEHLSVPVTRLTETASRIAAGERDLQAEVNGGPSEVTHLAEAFNSMTAQLRQSLHDLEHRFADLKRTQEALHESEERLRLALEGTSDGIWDWNLKTGRVYFSPRYYTMMGYEPDEFPPSFENWKRLVHPDDTGPAENAVRRAIEKRSQFAIEFRFKAKNGDWRWILGRGKVVELDTAGEALRVAGSHTDITDRKQAEIALQESEHKFRAVVENSQPIIFILDENGVFQLSEGLGLSRIGLAPGEVVGQSAFELYKDVPSIVEGIRLALDGKTNHTINVLGDVVFDTVYSPYFTPDVEKRGVVGIAIDITERTRAETAAKEHQERLALALQGADLGSWDWDIESGEISINERWAEMLGYQVEEIEPHARSWETLIHPEDMPRVREALNAHLEGITPFYETEHRLRHKYGEWIWVLDRGKVIDRDSAGRPLRAAGTHLDITERKRAEETLEKRIVALTRPLDAAEDIAFEDLFNLSDIQRLQDLYAEAFGVAALMTRPDGTPITQPSNFTELCGGIIRRTPLGIQNCEHSDAMIGRHNPSGPNIQPCLSAGLCNAGASITVGGRHVANWLIGQVRNEAQREEEILQYAHEIGADEALFRAAYRKVPTMSQQKFQKVAHVLFELANQISTTAYQNVQQARFITERKRAEETLRKYERIVSTSQDLIAMLNLEYVHEAANESLLRAHNKPREEVVGRTISEIMGESVFREKILPRLEQAISGLTIHYQDTFEFAGLGRRIMDMSFFPMVNETGKVEGIVLNCRDVTETRKLEEQLMQSQKIESIGTLAGGVAHEINNPINGIMNYAQLILDGMEEKSPATEYAQEILHETQRIARIVRNLLTFARREKQSHSPAQLSDIISSVLSLIQTVMRHDQIVLEVNIPDNLPRLKCRSQHIQQVLMNLMTNARDALNERYPGYSPDKKLRIFAELITKRDRRFIRTTVEDSGTGIPIEIRDRIFDPFFTTKPKETGTGLGLSISYGIVRDHGGELIVESEPDGNTRFHMDLPLDNGWKLSEK